MASLCFQFRSNPFGSGPIDSDLLVFASTLIASVHVPSFSLHLLSTRILSHRYHSCPITSDHLVLISNPVGLVRLLSSLIISSCSHFKSDHVYSNRVPSYQIAFSSNLVPSRPFGSPPISLLSIPSQQTART